MSETIICDLKTIKTITYTIKSRSSDKRMSIPMSDCHIIHDINVVTKYSKEYDVDCIDEYNDKEHKIWRWSCYEEVCDNTWCSKRLTFLIINGKKYLFIGDVYGASYTIVDFDSGEDVDTSKWIFIDSNEDEFYEFINWGLIEIRGAKKMIIPEAYKHIKALTLDQCHCDEDYRHLHIIL
jgi:hypothetical protein